MNRIPLFLLALGLLAGCGGSSSDNPDSDPEPESGQVIDSVVSGLPWSTDSLSGVTDENGRFQYHPGEKISFDLLGLQLGPVPARRLITPQLFNAVDERHDDYWLNLARLLQTLDTDGNPDNGITLPQDSGLPSLSGLQLDQATSTFESDATLQTLLSTLEGNVGLVTESAARQHFNTSMQTHYELELAGRTLFNWRTRQDCDPKLRNTFTYVLDETGYQMSGKSGDTHPDWSATCFPHAEPISGSGDYAAISKENVANVALSCGPECTYDDLNRTVNLDSGARIVISHLAGSKSIHASKFNSSDTLEERRILRLADPQRTINLAGHTITSKLYFPDVSGCDGGAVGTRTYEFGQDEVSITEPDGGHECDGYPMDGETLQYKNLSVSDIDTRDYWFSCAPTCSVAELNRTWSTLGYTNLLLDVAKEIMVWHEPGSTTITLQHMRDEYFEGVALDGKPEIFEARPREEIDLAPVNAQ